MCNVFCRWPTRSTIVINNFLFHRFSLLYMFRTNLLVHHQEHCIINCVIQYITLCSWWWTSKFFRNMYSKEEQWNKIDYKNFASRWSSTHYNMLHRTHKAKLIARHLNITKQLAYCNTSQRSNTLENNHHPPTPQDRIQSLFQPTTFHPKGLPWR